MLKFSLSLFATLVMFSVTLSAQAQITMSIGSLNGVGGRRFEQEQLGRGMNLADCELSDASATINLPQDSTVQNVDVWVTTSSSINCSEVEPRSVLMRSCYPVGLVAVNRDVGAIPTFTVTLAAIKAALDSAGVSSICEDTSNLTTSVTIYGLTTGNEFELGMVDPTMYGFVSLVVDSSRPTIPEVDSPSVEGDTQVEISWSANTQETTPTYRVYFDNEVNADCRSATLVGGQLAPPSTPEYDGTAFSTTLNPSELGLLLPTEGQDPIQADMNKKGVAHVTTVDVSGNESPLSEGVCVTRIQAFGFCTTEICDEESCSVSQGRHRSIPWATSLLLFSTILYRRKNWLSK